MWEVLEVIILILTSIAFIFSILLVYIESTIKPKKKREEEFFTLLPGYNCGACGYVGCEKMAEAMLEDPNNYQKCKPLKGDALEEMKAYLRKEKLGGNL